MLNLGRREDAEKPVLKPAQPMTGALNPAGQLTPSARPASPATPAARETTPAAPHAPESARNPASDKESGFPAIGPDTPGSKLCVGPKIKLKGVEISDCDVLVVEGEVEATVNSKAMQIAQPGMLKGHVAIDVAEIYGEFSGELTARSKLIIHSTGRVSGTIRYGKLIVAEGGVLSGDIQRLDTGAEHTPVRPPAHETRPPAHETRPPAHEARPLLSPQGVR
jgi:cytoskeletal protein CcmA (bactofilin family)